MLRRKAVSSAVARLVLATSLGLLGGCSASDDGATTTRQGDIRSSETWTDGLQLTGKVQIFPGATVEISPGAKITCGPGVQIVVAGVLKVASGAAHAKISCDTWTGIQVVSGGQLAIEGLDIENATVGIETTEDAGASKVSSSSILNAVSPFRVGPKSSLELRQVKATSTAESLYEAKSDIVGTLVASRLEYDAGPNEGIWLRDGGEATIEDSTLTGKNALDLVSARNAKKLVLSYSTLKGAHCGPHIQGIESFEITHIDSESNTFGITVYGAQNGVVRDSNLHGTSAWLDLQGDHGPLSFENVFAQGSELVIDTPPAEIKKSETRRPGTGPRP